MGLFLIGMVMNLLPKVVVLKKNFLKFNLCKNNDFSYEICYNVNGENMENTPFINNEFSKAMTDYLKTKEEPLSSSLSMPVIIIRTLIAIYGDIIINCFITKNTETFIKEINKYGFKYYDEFINSFTKFCQFIKEPNIFLQKTEEYLIDMLFLKKKSEKLTFNEIITIILKDYSDFYHLKDLDYYFAKQNFMSEHTFDLTAIKKTMLFMDAYALLGYSIKDISNMTSEELDKVNSKVYKFFKIDESEPNKNDLLIDAVNYYKRNKNRLTSGNGFVDFLLLISIVCTILFVLLLISIKIG